MFRKVGLGGEAVGRRGEEGGDYNNQTYLKPGYYPPIPYPFLPVLSLARCPARTTSVPTHYSSRPSG